MAKNTLNRIRFVVESLKIQPNPAKPMIPLSIGKFVISFWIVKSLTLINTYKENLVILIRVLNQSGYVKTNF